MLKRKTPKRVIEDAPNPENERRFIKYPREEPIDITSYAGPSEVRPKLFKRWLEFKKHKNKNYTDIHTHKNDPDYIAIFPSWQDISSFLLDNNNKTMVIAIKDKEGKNVLGYSIFSKTEKTPKIFSFFDDIIEAFSFGFYQNPSKKKLNQDATNFNKGPYRQNLDYIKEKYHLKERMVPAEGYKFDEKSSLAIKKSNLEKIAEVISFLIFFSGLFFLSSNLTGNVVSNLSQTSTNFIGLILSMIGIFAIISYLRKQKL